ncbi:MAG: 30S ribosome-binding factor RbfA [Candidatus Merdivicinus sp.]|jgi:ribosome-binding factor A
MASYKIGRLSEDIKRELSHLIRELKDPRISQMLSIIRCEVSGDLSHCKVHVSALEGEAATKESIKGLVSASGYLRREIGNTLHLRKCPEFHFIPDDSIAYSAKINRILQDLDESSPETDSDPSEE